MGSSPILAQDAPGSSVGRARTQRKMHLVFEKGVPVDFSKPVPLRPVIRATVIA